LRCTLRSIFRYFRRKFIKIYFFSGLYLQDIFFLDEGKNFFFFWNFFQFYYSGNKDRLESGLINFEKNFQFYKFIQKIGIHQQGFYKFHKVPEIQAFLLSREPFASDEIYQLSLRWEPRASIN
jgi:hypothetical protein